MLSYNIYYIKVIDSINKNEDMVITNNRIIINFIKYKMLIITVLTIIFSIISGTFFNRDINKYYIFFGFVQFFIGTGILIIGIVSFYYGAQQLHLFGHLRKNNRCQEIISNKVLNIALILIFLSIIAIPVSIVWFYTAIKFYDIIQNYILTTVLSIIWDIVCAPLAILITYIIILMDIEKNKFKLLVDYNNNMY
jgi:hypothetical protein